MNHIEPGVDVDRLLVAKVDLRTVGYSPAAREAFFDQALSQLRSLPQLERASIIHFELFTVPRYGVPWRLAGRERQAREGATLNLAGADYSKPPGRASFAGAGSVNRSSGYRTRRGGRRTSCAD